MSVDSLQTQYITTRLFVDMDGTLAVFRPINTLETLYQQGYFLNLAPNQNVVDAIKRIVPEQPNIEVFILSSVLGDSTYALQEKNAWLDQHLPEIDQAHRIFPACGEDKKAYVPGGIKPTDFLLDDYSQNLTLWEPPACGIKFMNGINGTHGTWQGYRVNHQQTPMDLAQAIVKPIHDIMGRVTISEVATTKEHLTDLRSCMSDKAVYDLLAPALDPENYRLLSAAKEITGVNLDAAFPSESKAGILAELSPSQQVVMVETATFGMHYQNNKEYQKYEGKLWTLATDKVIEKDITAGLFREEWAAIDTTIRNALNAQSDFRTEQLAMKNVVGASAPRIKEPLGVGDTETPNARDGLIAKTRTKSTMRRDRGGNGQIIQAIKEHFDILHYAESIYGLHFKPSSKGWMQCVEYDSMYIDPANQKFIRHSRHASGDIVDMAAHLDDIPAADAISRLRKEMDAGNQPRKSYNYSVFKVPEANPFLLPEKYSGRWKRMYAYLIETRKIPKAIVQSLAKEGLLYESNELRKDGKYHRNCVFVCKDYDGTVSSAMLRSPQDGKFKFIGEVEGGSKLGWIVNPNQETMLVGEAPIDMLSVMTMLQSGGKNLAQYTFLAQGGNPKHGMLAYHIRHNPRVSKVALCQDNDPAGHILAEAATKELREAGFKGEIVRKLPQGKDFNADLVNRRYLSNCITQKESVTQTTVVAQTTEEVIAPCLAQE